MVLREIVLLGNYQIFHDTIHAFCHPLCTNSKQQTKSVTRIFENFHWDYPHITVREKNNKLKFQKNNEDRKQKKTNPQKELRKRLFF